MAVDEADPLVRAAVRVGSAVFAAVVVAVGFFEESLAYAVVVGLVLGVGFAAVEHVRDRRDGDGNGDGDRFDQS